MATQALRSVLYVDDDPDICAIVHATLRFIGNFEVSTAASGPMAIEAAVAAPPDLILMDVMMPGLDGPSTFRRMREIPALAHVPVVFLTAKVMPEEVGSFLQLGVIGVIAKPFDPAELCANLNELWNGRTHIRAHPQHGRGAGTAAAASLARGFLQGTGGEVVRLQEILARAHSGDPSALGEAERISHAIHGAAAMFGFPEISASGAAIECQLRRLRTDKSAAGAAGESAVMEKLMLRAEGLARELDAALREG